MTEVINRLEQSTRKKRLTLKQGWNAVNILISECQTSIFDPKFFSYLHESGASIKLSDSNFQSSRDRILDIEGEIQTINQIFKTVYDRIAQTGESDPEGWFDCTAGSQATARVNSGQSVGTIFPDEVDKFVLRILIPSSEGGLLIGKAGVVINELREKFNCQMRVPDIVAPYRVCRSIFNNEVDLKGYLDQVLPIIQKTMDNDIVLNLSIDKDVHGIKLLVHTSHAGQIIGKGGEVVCELREKYKCEIKLISECIPDTTDRIMILKGKKTNLINLIEHILLSLKEKPINGKTRRLEAVVPEKDHQTGQLKKPRYDGKHDEQHDLNQIQHKASRNSGNQNRNSAQNFMQQNQMGQNVGQNQVQNYGPSGGNSYQNQMANQMPNQMNGNGSQNGNSWGYDQTPFYGNQNNMGNSGPMSQNNMGMNNGWQNMNNMSNQQNMNNMQNNQSMNNMPNNQNMTWRDMQNLQSPARNQIKQEKPRTDGWGKQSKRNFNW